MELRKGKYVLLGILFIGVGILLANLLKNYAGFSIAEFILSCLTIILLSIAPYFILKSKPSKYRVLSLIFRCAAYAIIIILFLFCSNLPDHFVEIGVLIICIIAFASLIFSLGSIAYGLEDFLRLLQRKNWKR